MNTTTTAMNAPTVRIPRQDAPTPAAPQRTIDAGRLWTGGLATAVVAALIGLVGVLVVRVVVQVAPHAVAPFGHGSATTVLCLSAAGAALAATGLAHLLLVSTPRPLAYLGWIVGLATAAAAVLPLTAGLPLTAAAAEGVINLVIGLAVGSLVAGAAVAATRGRSTGW